MERPRGMEITGEPRDLVEGVFEVWYAPSLTHLC